LFLPPSLLLISLPPFLLPWYLKIFFLQYWHLNSGPQAC
jgi:hypothetical protein